MFLIITHYKTRQFNEKINFFSNLIIAGAFISCSTKEHSISKHSQNFTELNDESIIEAYSLFAQSGVFYLSSYKIRDGISDDNIDAFLIQQIRLTLDGYKVEIDQLFTEDGIEEKHILAMILAERNNISLEFRVEESDKLRNAKIKLMLENLEK